MPGTHIAGQIPPSDPTTLAFGASFSCIEGPFLVPVRRGVRPDTRERLGGDLTALGYDEAELIGRGRFETVYRARMNQSGQVVAVKVFGVDFTDSAVQEMFHYDLLLASQIPPHANLVGILDWGMTDEGRPYLATEYCSGGSLEEQVERDGPVSLVDVLDVGVRLAAALAHLHERGVMHRDIGPHNVLIRADGEPALTDIAIGPLIAQAGGADRVPRPAYAAPEVLQGHPPTSSSDTYSLGATLFYLLAGRPPYSTYDNPLAVIMGGERPQLARADVAPSVLAQILKAMSIRPEDRYADAAAFAAALARQQRELGFPVTELRAAGGPAAAPIDFVPPPEFGAPPEWADVRTHRGAHRADDPTSDAVMEMPTHELRRLEDDQIPGHEPLDDEPIWRREVFDDEPMRRRDVFDDEPIRQREPFDDEPLAGWSDAVAQEDAEEPPRWPVRARRLRWRLAAVTVALLTAAIIGPALLVGSNSKTEPPAAVPTGPPVFTFGSQYPPVTAEPSPSVTPTPEASPSESAAPATTQPSSTYRASGPSGQALPVGDLPGWKQIFTEDFTTDVPVGSFEGSAYDNRWDVYGDGDDDTGHGVYFPSKVLSVKNGLLNVHVHSENGVQMGAAVVVDLPGPGRGLVYGRFTVRIRSDPVAGYRVGTVFWPDTDRTEEGFFEFPSGDLDGTMGSWVEYAQSADGGDGFDTSATFSGWHTATTEWSPGQVKFILDGQVIGVVNNSKVPSTTMHMVIQTETCECPPTSASGNLQVDWVAIYSRA